METRGKVVVGLVVVALVAGAVWWWLRPAPVEEGVVFVGDSVTYLSLEDLNDDLGSRHPAYLTRVGFRSRDLVPLLEEEVARKERAGEPLRQVALLVGYNDVLRDDEESPALDRLMGLAGRFDCAVWLLLPVVPMHDVATERWNERVRASAEEHGVEVADDWQRAVEGAAPRELLDADGVHPNRAGRARLTTIYQDVIGRTC